MFADGSIDHTCGVLRTSFTVGHVADDSEFVARGKTLSLNFYVLDGLTSDNPCGPRHAGNTRCVC